jgi:flagellar motor switch protein FliG
MTKMIPRISSDIKKRMEKFPDVNWNEVIETALLNRLMEEEQKQCQRDQRKIEAAVELMNKLRRPVSDETIEAIKQWREHRSS